MISCLNRTSVGLKPGINRHPPPGPRDGLNRTSVGLKLLAGPGEGERRPRRPQSNQRGIETVSTWATRVHMPHGLNRTSVGLKLELLKELWEQQGRPQSNQRGIETEEGEKASDGNEVASIEPAWD